MTKQEMLSKLKNVNGFQPRKERVKQGKFVLEVNNDGTLDATSYGHWTFFTMINEIYVFNWYHYSNTTRKHQHAMSSIARNLGIDYLTVSYRKSIGYLDLNEVLKDKINSLYQGENDQSLKRQGAYPCYTENAFNETMNDIKKIAAALKMPQKTLDNMFLEAELNASHYLIEVLVSAHEKRVSRRQAQKLNENLSAIEL